MRNVILGVVLGAAFVVLFLGGAIWSWYTRQQR